MDLIGNVWELTVSPASAYKGSPYVEDAEKRFGKTHLVVRGGFDPKKGLTPELRLGAPSNWRKSAIRRSASGWCVPIRNYGASFYVKSFRIREGHDFTDFRRSVFFSGKRPGTGSRKRRGIFRSPGTMPKNSSPKPAKP
jgi:hypothetical protein